MESRNAADLVRALYTALAAGDREQFVAAVRGGAGGGDWDCSTPPSFYGTHRDSSGYWPNLQFPSALHCGLVGVCPYMGERTRPQGIRVNVVSPGPTATA